MKNQSLNSITTFFVSKIIIPFLLLSCYSIIIIWILFKIGYWKIFLLKYTLFWFFGFAFIIFINSNKAIEEDGFLKKVLIDNFKLYIVIQFIVNMYVFSLPIEIILTPISTILVIMMNVSAKNMKEYKTAYKFSNAILCIIGLVLVIFSFSAAITDLNNFLSSVTFLKLTLSLILTFFLIPFIYFIALLIMYETIFIYLSNKEYYRKNLKHIKCKLITTCKLKLSRLKRFHKIMNQYDLSTKEGVNLAMSTIQTK